MPRAAVLGSPIAHSLSPLLHRAAYAALGLEGWTYGAIECDEIGLPALLSGLGEEWAGLSLTMPLKRAVLPLADEVSDLAQQIGAANTLLLRAGRRIADNTDAGGMADALREAGCGSPASAVVLGAGGTACAALAALRELGLREVAVAVRDPARARDLEAAAERLGVEAAVFPWQSAQHAGWVDLLVSTVPATAADAVARIPLGPATTVFDVIYDPWPTPLATRAERDGRRVVGGLDLLLHQAARQVELMTGQAAPVPAMRAALAAR